MMPMGATLGPARGTYSIMWTAKYRDGGVTRFKLPIRTTRWGTIVRFPDDARPSAADVTSTMLFGEDKYLGLDPLPVPGET